MGMPVADRVERKAQGPDANLAMSATAELG
jgi:hypothetical protein